MTPEQDENIGKMLEILKSEPEFEDKYEVYDWSSETKTDVKTYWKALGQCGGPLTDKLNLKDDTGDNMI